MTRPLLQDSIFYESVKNKCLVTRTETNEVNIVQPGTVEALKKVLPGLSTDRFLQIWCFSPVPNRRDSQLARDVFVSRRLCVLASCDFAGAPGLFMRSQRSE